MSDHCLTYHISILVTLATETEEEDKKNTSETSASSLTRKGSKHSDTSSQYSSDSSSPRMRKNKLKFIKNIKPEAFKRPSSFMMAESGTASNQVRGSVAVDEKDCSLVGYRKIETSPTQPIVELGTLSPGGNHSLLSEDSAVTKNALYNAVSMPTLLAKGHFNMTTSGSMPDLTANITSDLERSSVDLSSMIRAGTGSGSESTRTDPTAETSSIDKATTVQSTRDAGHSNAGSSSVSPSDSSSNMQNVQNGYITSESDRNSPTEQTEASASRVDYNLIADSLTKALGEPEDHGESQKSARSFSLPTVGSSQTSEREGDQSKSTKASSDNPAENTPSLGDNLSSTASIGDDTSDAVTATSGLGESISTLTTQDRGCKLTSFECELLLGRVSNTDVHACHLH